MRTADEAKIDPWNKSPCDGKAENASPFKTARGMILPFAICVTMLEFRCNWIGNMMKHVGKL